MGMILDTDKKRIASFIDARFNQVKKENSAYTLNQFTRGICSLETYQEMISGTILDDRIYTLFLKKIGYQYNNDEGSIATFMADEAEIYHLLEQQDMKTYSKMIKMLLEMMEPYRHYALESVAYDCLQITLSLEINAHEYMFLMQRYAMLDMYTKEICGYFLLRYIYRHLADTIDEEWLVKKGLRNLKLLGSQIYILRLLVRFEQYYDASIYCDQLLNRCIQKENKQLAYIVKIQRLFIMMKIQPGHFERYADEMMSDPIMNEGESDTYIFEFYHVMGLHYYIDKKYERAWLYFIRAIQDKKYYFPEIIFLNHIATVQNKELPDLMKASRKIDEKHRMYQPLYTYYRLKNRKEPPQKLEDHLWDRCIRNLDQFSPNWVMKHIILDELDWIARRTGNKKRLHAFKEME